VKPTPLPEKMRTKVISVVAEGDLVVVAYVHDVKDAKDPRRAIPRRGSICGVSRMAKRTNIGIRRRGCNDFMSAHLTGRAA